MSGRSDCRKFAPNIFNKSKCTNCFRQKEEHSAEALESNRVSGNDPFKSKIGMPNTFFLINKTRIKYLRVGVFRVLVEYVHVCVG